MKAEHAEFYGANGEQPGPMILDPNGRLVWFEPVTRGEPMNLQVQRYQDRPVLLLSWLAGRTVEDELRARPWRLLTLSPGMRSKQNSPARVDAMLPP